MNQAPRSAGRIARPRAAATRSRRGPSSQRDPEFRKTTAVSCRGGLSLRVPDLGFARLMVGRSCRSANLARRESDRTATRRSFSRARRVGAGRERVAAARRSGRDSRFGRHFAPANSRTLRGARCETDSNGRAVGESGAAKRRPNREARSRPPANCNFVRYPDATQRAPQVHRQLRPTGDQPGNATIGDAKQQPAAKASLRCSLPSAGLEGLAIRPALRGTASQHPVGPRRGDTLPPRSVEPARRRERVAAARGFGRDSRFVVVSGSRAASSGPRWGGCARG